jgi:hypothetical protein
MPKALAAMRKMLKGLDVDESVACKGTSLESTTFVAGKKAFAFVREKNGACQVRIKVDASKAELAKLAKKSPEQFNVGSQGWALVTFPDSASPPKGLSKWLVESHGLMSK